MDKITIDNLQEISNNLNKIKPHERNGYILLPSIEGFDLFEINEDRLRKYLVAEQMYLKNK